MFQGGPAWVMEQVLGSTRSEPSFCHLPFLQCGIPLQTEPALSVFSPIAAPHP